MIPDLTGSLAVIRLGRGRGFKLMITMDQDKLEYLLSRITAYKAEYRGRKEEKDMKKFAICPNCEDVHEDGSGCSCDVDW